MYSPFTSAELTEVGSAVYSDLSSFGNLPELPSLKQVIFFALGIIALIASLALIIRTLAASELPIVASVAKAAAV